MKNLSLLFLTTILTACASTPNLIAADTSKTLIVNQNRLVEVIGVVNMSIIEGPAKRVEELSRDSSDPIYILLNSPGGSVTAGTSMIDAVKIAKHRGAEVVCFSGVLAASMAFNIMAHCDRRYAFENTKLLFHPVSLSGRGMRLAELIISAESMAKEEKRMMNFLRAKLGLSWKDFHRHYFAETLWTGQGLESYAPDFLEILSDVRGVDNLFVFTKPRKFTLFGKKSSDQKEAERIVKPILERFNSN